MKRLSVLAPLAIALVAGLFVSLPPATAATTVRESLSAMIKALPVSAPSHASSYNRTTDFGSWTYHVEPYGSHCDTRAVVLTQESKVAVTRSATTCTVHTGKWVSIYNGKTYTNAYGGTYVQIDHMVPVENAWIMGAWAWTKTRRVAFYNDLGDARSLNAVDTASNEAKGDRTPAAWMPAVGHCRYIEWWAAVKTRWSLKVTSAEKAALLKYVSPCGNPTMTVTKA